MKRAPSFGVSTPLCIVEVSRPPEFAQPKKLELYNYSRPRLQILTDKKQTKKLLNSMDAFFSEAISPRQGLN
jgi:hypothetical protein